MTSPTSQSTALPLINQVTALATPTANTPPTKL
jgi:hypothetical protein